MLIRPATTRDCERLFRRELERRGHRFDHYKRRHQPRAALALVQAQSLEATPASAVTVNITSSSGNLIAVFTRNGLNNTSTVAITDSAGQSGWIQTASGYVSQGTTERSSIWFRPNSAALTSVTATWSGGLSTRIDCIVFEISGAALSSVEDTSVNNTDGSGTTANSGTFTTTNADDILLFGVGWVGGPTSPVAGAGYAIPTNGSLARTGMQYRIVSAIQTAQTTTMTWTGALASANVFAAFKAAAGGGGLLVNMPYTPGDGAPAMPCGNAVSY